MKELSIEQLTKEFAQVKKEHLGRVAIFKRHVVEIHTMLSPIEIAQMSLEPLEYIQEIIEEHKENERLITLKQEELDKNNSFTRIAEEKIKQEESNYMKLKMLGILTLLAVVLIAYAWNL